MAAFGIGRPGRAADPPPSAAPPPAVAPADLTVPGAGDPVPNTLSVQPEALIRQVVKNQRLAEQTLTAYTFDQRETETKYGKDGRAESMKTRLFYAFSGENGEPGTRELVEVDGRPATDAEKRKVAEEDAKGRRQRLERRAAAKVSKNPSIQGTDDDPIVGSRKLSDLLARYSYRMSTDQLLDGRTTHVLDFEPRKGPKPTTLMDKALNSLAGRALIDAVDGQVRRVDAHLTEPVKVVGGLAAKVHEARISYEATPVRDRWFPRDIQLRLKGKKALLFRLDVGYRFQLSNFKSFEVDTESKAGPEAGHVSASTPRSSP
ncbi:MAG: hypothetical protein ABIT01_07810 [Thermoanaerobaculia bacterium]